MVLSFVIYLWRCWLISHCWTITFFFPLQTFCIKYYSGHETSHVWHIVLYWCVSLIVGQYEPELFPGLIYRMKQPKIVLLIFVSGKIVLTGAKVVSSLGAFRIQLYFSCFTWPALLFSLFRWGMKRIRPSRTYTQFLMSSGKINNGKALASSYSIFNHITWVLMSCISYPVMLCMISGVSSG